MEESKEAFLLFKRFPFAKKEKLGTFGFQGRQARRTNHIWLFPELQGTSGVGKSPVRDQRSARGSPLNAYMPGVSHLSRTIHFYDFIHGQTKTLWGLKLWVPNVLYLVGLLSLLSRHDISKTWEFSPCFIRQCFNIFKMFHQRLSRFSNLVRGAEGSVMKKGCMNHPWIPITCVFPNMKKITLSPLSVWGLRLTPHTGIGDPCDGPQFWVAQSAHVQS